MQMIFTYFKLIMYNQIQMPSPKHLYNISRCSNLLYAKIYILIDY